MLHKLKRFWNGGRKKVAKNFGKLPKDAQHLSLPVISISAAGDSTSMAATPHRAEFVTEPTTEENIAQANIPPEVSITLEPPVEDSGAQATFDTFHYIDQGIQTSPEWQNAIGHARSMATAITTSLSESHMDHHTDSPGNSHLFLGTSTASSTSHSNGSIVQVPAQRGQVAGQAPLVVVVVNVIQGPRSRRGSIRSGTSSSHSRRSSARSETNGSPCTSLRAGRSGSAGSRRASARFSSTRLSAPHAWRSSTEASLANVNER